MKLKSDVQVGDVIHIYNIWGESQYREREGVVKYIDDMNQIHGTWDGPALHFDDDWEIIVPVNEN